MKKWFNIFVYFSLVFLIVALVKADYLKIPEIQNHAYIISGLLFVCLGFIFDTYAWYKTLIHFGYGQIKVSDAIISMGLSIFGKYVPGKVWSIIGRSAYIARKYELPEKNTAIVSLNAQFISFWVGLFLGIIGFLFIGSRYYLLELSLLVWVFFTVLLFSRFFHRLVIKLIRKIFKKEVTIPSLSIQSTLSVLPWFLINWMIWCAGFYFLAKGLSPGSFTIFLGFAFASAGTLSLLFLIIPGALGVREGLLGIILVTAGFNESLAVTVSLASRLWFLSGELFIFLVALILERKSVRGASARK